MSKGGFESALSRAYKLVFVPYAFVFLVYIFFSVVAAAFLAFFGLSALEAGLACGILIGIALLAISVRELLRFAIMRRARRHSPNPKIRKITETNTLRFLESGMVEYTTQLELMATSRTVKEMDFLIGWSGRSTDIAFYDCVGCKIQVEDKIGHYGKVLKIQFPETLPKGVIYPVSFTAMIDCSEETIKPYLRKVGPYIAELSLTQSIILPEKSKGFFTERVERNSGDKRPIKEEFIQGTHDSHTSTTIRPVQGFSYYVGLVADSD